jgi:type IV pilus assembly protein PilM
MSERDYRIDLVAGVAMPETAPLAYETGWAETEHLAEVIDISRARRVFGFARAFEVDAPRTIQYRTEVRFRRVWPGQREVEVEQFVVTPAWRNEISFRRPAAEESVTTVETLPTGAATLAASVTDVSFRESEEEHAAVAEPEVNSEPSSIAPVTVLASEEDAEHHETDDGGHDGAEPADEPEVIELAEAEPEEAALAVADEAPVAAAPVSAKSGGTPKEKRSRRGGRGPKTSRLVGLKVGASQLAAAVVENEGRPELVQLARTPFETGVVVDGEVRDEDALAQALGEFFDQANLPRRGVRIGLASNRIGVRTLDIAGIDDAERFDNAVRFKAHEVLPIAMNESVLDYRVIGDSVDANGEPAKRVLLVVAPREQVDPYINACQKAGIRIDGIDLEAFALLRTFVEPGSEQSSDQAAVVVVNIGHESTTLVVSGAGVCEFTRVFGWGGAQLDAAIAAACGVDGLEAAAIKTQLSLDGDLPAGIDPGQAGKALEAVRTELTLFARELVSSLQFYQKQPDSLGIGEIVVTGGTSQLDGLPDALHTLVGVPVRQGDPLGRVSAGRDVTSDPTLSDTIGSLSVAIGLGIDDDPARAVNLLPADAKVSARKRPSRTQVLVPVALAVPVVALAAALIPAKSQVSSRESELDTLKAELATLPEPSGPGIDSSIKGEQARRAAVVADVLSRRTAWDRVLRDLSLVVPGDVWLTSLQGSVPQPLSVVSATAMEAAPPPPDASSSPTGLRISGHTFGQAGVARLLARLSTVPTLSGVQLVSSTRVDKGKRKVIQFEVAANLRGAGEPT